MVVVVSDRYLSSSPVEFTVSEKALSFSGESFTISDVDGSTVFKMDGHALSIRDRCTLLDPDGNPILTARKKVILVGKRHTQRDRFKHRT